MAKKHTTQEIITNFAKQAIVYCAFKPSPGFVMTTSHSIKPLTERKISMSNVSNDSLFNLLEGIEFCDNETGHYFRASAVTTESTGTVVILERIE